jgi:sugar lactone lactonase YvrE
VSNPFRSLRLAHTANGGPQRPGGRTSTAIGGHLVLVLAAALGTLGAAVAAAGTAGAATGPIDHGVLSAGAGARPDIRPSLAGPGPGTVFTTNQGGLYGTATGYSTSATGNVAPTYAVGGAPTSPFESESFAFDSSGNLWVGNINSIVEYTKSQLAQSGTPTPAVTLTSTSSYSIDVPDGLAFDKSGDLWVANGGGNYSGDHGSVVEFTPSELAASGSPTPAVTISPNVGNTNLDKPYGLAFDGSGNLWVANYGSDSVVEFTASQLTASGTTSANVTVGTGSGTGPNGPTFDSSGNLWVAYNTTNQVAEFTAPQLTASGSPTPAVLLSASSGSLDSPTHLTFDSSGNLWVANSAGSTDGNGSVVEFTGPFATGSPPPKVTLSSNGSGLATSLVGAFDVAFDASGTMWVANGGGETIAGFTPSQYASTGSPAPAVQIGPAYGIDSTPELEAFDTNGNLWIANPRTDTVLGFTPSQLASGATRPAISLTLANPPSGLAFDASGDLWVSDAGNHVDEFTPSQLAASGTPTPAVVLGATGGSLNGPEGLAFDASGDLWVANNGGSTVVEFTPSQLSASGSPSPTVTLSATGTSLDNPVGLAFDAAGDLWAANATNSTLVDFTPSQLAASGSPSPTVTLSSTASGSLDSPQGIAFDAAGDLWVANHANNSLVELAPSQLTSTGTPTPTSTVTGALTGLTGPEGVALPPASERPAASGYWEVAADGGIFSFGNHPFYGSMGGKPLDQPVVGMAATPVVGSSGGKGYWEVAADGGIFSFGDATFYGSMGGKPLNQPVVGIAATPDGKGYWEVAKDGGIFAFGDAGFYGSMGGKPLNQPVVGIAATPDGKGYWEVAADGGIFAFGDATFYGSMGGKPLNQPVVGIAATPDGKGYWEVAKDGGIFAFGDATFYGSMGGKPLNQPVVGITATNDGSGYFEVAADGGIFAFGDATFYGSMGGKPLDQPVVGIAA